MDFLIRGSDYLKKHEGFHLVDREIDLQRLTSILMRSRASSVVLVGAGGVGCTALCLGVQVAKNAPDAPFDLVNKRLFWLDTNGLFGCGEGDEMRKAFHRIIERLNRIHGSILIIEDARDFIEGCRSSGTTHFLNALFSTVGAGGSQIIFETKDEDLDLVLRCHSDTRELFTVLPLDEPSGDALRAIVGACGEHLTVHHGIAIDPAAIDTAISLTNKYQTRDAGLSRAQPERSLTLIDRALAAYRLSVHRNPPGYNDTEWAGIQEQLRRFQRDQRDGEVQITELEDELDKLHKKNASEPEASKVAAFDSAAEMEIRRKMRLFQTEVDRCRQEFGTLTHKVNQGLRLSADLVLSEFSDISGIPVNKLNQNEIEKLKFLDTTLGRRIFGQDEVIRKVSNGIRVAKVGRRNGPRPLAAYLFLGPSGVGKSECAKVIASAMLDDEAALTRFDMSEYMEKHAVSRLIGAPPGYEGFEAGGILTNFMRRNGHRVLLFDEIEKAHPDVFNIMLQVLDAGRLTDNIGRTVSFSDAIIIMTTNIGQPHFLNTSLSSEEAEAAAIIDLNHNYRSEFLNRFAGRQNILCFKPLGLDSIEKIVKREIDSLDAVYGEKGIRVDISPEHIAAFCRDLYDPTVGARGLPGFLSANLEPMLVNAILENPEIQGTAVVTYDETTKHFKVDVR